MVAKAIDGQQTFFDLGLIDLKVLDADLRRDAEEIEAANSLEEAIQSLEKHMGFDSDDMLALTKTTPIGDITIERDSLSHIVEKRQNARERYVKFALDTL